MQPSPPQTPPTQQLRTFKVEIRKSIQSDSFLLPLHNYEKIFDFGKLSYIDRPKSQLSLNSKSIWTLVRLLQIVEIVEKLIEKREIITKRNLYYKLVRYYQDRYNQVDYDLEILSSNLKINREDLKIFSSSRCLLFGHLTINAQHLKCQPSIITNIPILESSARFQTLCTTLVIVEKESALYQIHQQLSGQNSNKSSLLKETTIFLSSKGYPDSTSRTVVAGLLPFVSNIYFLGDSDIYGLDILLCYAIAYKQWPCLLAKLHWVQLEKLVIPKEDSLDYLTQKKEDKLKCLSLLERPYFKQIDFFLPKNEEEQTFKRKMMSWREKAREIHKNKSKMQLECLFKELPQDWMEKAFLEENCL